MDDLTLKEEMQILNAANLAESDAPEKLDVRRAREFVHGTIKSDKSRKWTVLKSPATYVALAVAACVVIVLMVVNPDSGSPLQVMQQEQVHAAADSVDAVKDSLEVKSPEAYELISIDE